MFNTICYSATIALALLNLIAMSISFEYFFVVVTKKSGLTFERCIRALLASFIPLVCLYSMGQIVHGISYRGKDMLTCSIAEDVCKYSRKDMKTLQLIAYPRLFFMILFTKLIHLPTKFIVKPKN